MNRPLPVAFSVLAAAACSVLPGRPVSARDSSGGMAGSSSAYPAQYRGPSDETRSRRAPSPDAGPVPGSAHAAAVGRDRWEFWFEYEKDTLLRDALALPRVGAGEDPLPAGTVPFASKPLSVADIRVRLLPTLRLALLDPVSDIRGTAMVALGNAGDNRSLPVLVSELRGGSVEGRRAAAMALGFLGDPGSVVPLGDALLHDQDEETRSRAALALGLAGSPPAVALLRHSLVRCLKAGGENRFDFVADLVVSLGLSGDRSQSDLLQKALLSDEVRDWRVHAAAAWALARVGNPTALPSLRTALREARDPRLRRSVVLAIGAFADRIVAGDLRATLASDPDGLVQGLAAVSLARVEGAASVPFLAPFTEGKYPRSTRGFAALALGLSGDAARAGPLLRDLLDLNGEDSVRGAAAVGLGLLRYGPSADDLAAVVRDSASSPALRGYALLGAALTGHSSVPALLRSALVEDGPPEVLRGAALGAGVLPFPGSDLLLLHVIAEAREPTVRAAAILGLGLAADRGALPLLQDMALDTEGRAPLSRLQAVITMGQLALQGRLPPLARISSGAGCNRLTPATDSLTRGF